MPLPRTRLMNDQIVIRGAREHNLKNVDLDIPRNQLVVITGCLPMIDWYANCFLSETT